MVRVAQSSLQAAGTAGVCYFTKVDLQLECVSDRAQATLQLQANKKFFEVKLTNDKILTMEGPLTNRGELVVRDLLCPNSTPLLVVQWPLFEHLCYVDSEPCLVCCPKLVKVLRDMSAGDLIGKDNVETSSATMVPNAEGLVIEVVEHDDPAAQVSQQEATLLENERRISWMTSSLETSTVPESSQKSDNAVVYTGNVDFEKVLLLRFTRHPRAFEERLHEGHELETVRWTMEQAGCSQRLASGATILVRPEHYAAAKEGVARHSLGHQHVVVSECFLPLVLQAIQSLATRLKIRLRSMEIVAYISPNPGNCDDDDVFIVEHTFLAGPPPRSHNSQSVTQSTTEAHGSRNPRRRVAMP